MNNEKTVKRVYYVDYLRIFGFLSVIFMHCAYDVLANTSIINTFDWKITAVVTGLAYTAVPLFFMMSGYFLLTSKKTHDLSVLVKHRLPRLILPLFFWSLVAIVWILYNTDALTFTQFAGQVVKSFSQPVYVHFWYMYTLIAMYIASPFIIVMLENISRKEHILIFALITLITVQVMLYKITPAPLNLFFDMSFLGKFQFFGGHICAFMLGYYLGKSERHVPNILLIVLALLCWAGITVGTIHLSVTTNTYDGTFFSQSEGYEVLFAACLFLLAKQNLNRSNKHLDRLICPLVALSLPIYLFHNLLLSVLLTYGGKITGFADIVLYTIIIAFVSYLLNKTLCSVKPLSFVVTGLTYKKAGKTANWQYTYHWVKNACSRNKTIEN